MSTRREHDLLGERDVPADAYYGVHTLRAVENFPITGTPISIYPDLVWALASIKLAAARSNRELGLLDRDKALFEEAAIVYLVTQVGISELRNCNRLISEFFQSRDKLEIVLNRFASRSVSIDEENITKALTRPAQWKIPSDYPSVQRAQNTATPLAMEDSPISRVIRQMARTACGLPANPEKKKRFGLFG